METKVAKTESQLRRGERKRRGPKPKPLTAGMSRYRRREANARERQRQGEINKGFELLRERVPHPTLSKGKCEKLRKIDVLHVAISYIRALENVLESGEPGINDFANSLYSVVPQDFFSNNSSSTDNSSQRTSNSNNISSGEEEAEDSKHYIQQKDGKIPDQNTTSSGQQKPGSLNKKSDNSQNLRFHANLVRYKPVLLGERKRKQPASFTQLDKLSSAHKKTHSTEASSDEKLNYTAEQGGRKVSQSQQCWKEGSSCLGDSSENMEEYFSDISFSSTESEIFSDVSLLDSVSLPTLDSMITSFTPPPDSPPFLQEYTNTALPQEYFRASSFIQDHSRSIHSHPTFLEGVLDEPTLSVY